MAPGAAGLAGAAAATVLLLPPGAGGAVATRWLAAVCSNRANCPACSQVCSAASQGPYVCYEEVWPQTRDMFDDDPFGICAGPITQSASRWNPRMGANGTCHWGDGLAGDKKCSPPGETVDYDAQYRFCLCRDRSRLDELLPLGTDVRCAPLTAAARLCSAASTVSPSKSATCANADSAGQWQAKDCDAHCGAERCLGDPNCHALEILYDVDEVQQVALLSAEAAAARPPTEPLTGARCYHKVTMSPTDAPKSAEAAPSAAPTVDNTPLWSGWALVVAAACGAASSSQRAETEQHCRDGARAFHHAEGSVKRVVETDDLPPGCVRSGGEVLYNPKQSTPTACSATAECICRCDPRTPSPDWLTPPGCSEGPVPSRAPVRTDPPTAGPSPLQFQPVGDCVAFRAAANCDGSGRDGREDMSCASRVSPDVAGRCECKTVTLAAFVCGHAELSCLDECSSDAARSSGSLWRYASCIGQGCRTSVTVDAACVSGCTVSLQALERTASGIEWALVDGQSVPVSAADAGSSWAYVFQGHGFVRQGEAWVVAVKMTEQAERPTALAPARFRASVQADAAAREAGLWDGATGPYVSVAPADVATPVPPAPPPAGGGGGGGDAQLWVIPAVLVPVAVVGVAAVILIRRKRKEAEQQAEAQRRASGHRTIRTGGADGAEGGGGTAQRRSRSRSRSVDETAVVAAGGLGNDPNPLPPPTDPRTGAVIGRPVPVTTGQRRRRQGSRDGIGAPSAAEQQRIPGQPASDDADADAYPLERKSSVRTADGQNITCDPGDASQGVECCVCLEKEKNVVFIPCKHLCCCNECAETVRQCPLCRVDVVSRIEVYM